MSELVRIGQRFDAEEEKYIVRGEDVWLYDGEGRRYLDLCGGIWNTPFGYGHPYLIEKINKQLEQLPFCNLITHTADVQLSYASRLAGILQMPKVAFTCSGSEAVEAAIKAARQYQEMRGSGRKEIAAFDLSYHGTSYGAMSVSGLDQELTKPFGPLLSGITWICTPLEIYDTKKWLAALRRLFETRGDFLAAVIIEPIIASGGVVAIPDEVLHYMEEQCRERDILLIDDEVTTGFGRTGVPFVYQEKKMGPDLLCLSKGITNGYLPFGVLAFSRRVADAFIANRETFEHFSSQSGNLLSIAAADGVLDLLEDYESYQVREKGERFRAVLKRELQGLSGMDIRGRGLASAIAFPPTLPDSSFRMLLGAIARAGILSYYFVNPGHNKGLSFFPPFTIETDTLEKAAGMIARKIKRVPELLIPVGLSA